MLVLLLFALLFLPALLTLVWHLRHGHTIETRGKTVQVPLGWTAEVDGGLNIEMFKYPATMLNGMKFDATISLSRNFVPPHTSVERMEASWQAFNWNLADDLGAVMTDPVRSGSGSSETLCMKSSSPKSPDFVSIRCLVQQDPWNADFDGDKKNLGIFYAIVQKMN
jgi:hypothetical protein